MTAYAIANLRDVNLGAGIVEYLERIDTTSDTIIVGGVGAEHKATDVLG
jgi:hypothetical protein